MSDSQKERLFKELFDSCYNKLYYIAYGILGNPDMAEDIVEETFVQLWEKRKTSNEMQEVSYSYLVSVVHNACHDYLRHTLVEKRFADFYIKAHTEGYLENDDLREERLERINKVRASMPEKTRRIMDMCYFENKKYEEVALIMGLTKNGVRKQMIKALSMLRAAFSVNKPKRQGLFRSSSRK